MFKFSQRSIDNLIGVHPRLTILMGLSILDSPIDFTIVEGVRSTARQQELYAQGRTKPGLIVTQVDGIRQKSEHQTKADGTGWAVDIYPFVNGSVQLNDAQSLITIANHIKSKARLLGYNISWGGDWQMRDFPHFELK